VRTANPSHE